MTTLEKAYSQDRESLLRWIESKLCGFPDSGDLAEDILQDAWLRAMKAPEPEDGNWSGFLNLAVNWQIGAFLEKELGRRDGSQSGRELLERKNADKITRQTMSESVRSPGPRVDEEGNILN